MYAALSGRDPARPRSGVIPYPPSRRMNPYAASERHRPRTASAHLASPLMGFFSTLKNSLTGNWADVSVQMPSAARGEVAPFTVNVSVKDEAIAIEKVVVQVRCQETITLNDYRVGRSQTTPRKAGTAVATSNHATVDVRHTETLFDQEVTVAGAQTLDANSHHTFEGSVTLPTHVSPTIRGRNYGRTCRPRTAPLTVRGR